MCGGTKRTSWRIFRNILISPHQGAFEYLSKALLSGRHRLPPKRCFSLLRVPMLLLGIIGNGDFLGVDGWASRVLARNPWSAP
ncbi:hypothetical protein SAMN05519103_00708 [Rhizobiales bacterium GAS113]|nr:hypothetical protein SAMN05519103_00708 [Rhizobiales bacterium GAS113]